MRVPTLAPPPYIASPHVPLHAPLQPLRELQIQAAVPAALEPIGAGAEDAGLRGALLPTDDASEGFIILGGEWGESHGEDAVVSLDGSSHTEQHRF